MLNRNPDKYLSVRAVYDKGHIKSIADIFRFVPKTPFTEHIGITLPRFNKCLNKAEKFTLEELMKIGKPFGWTIDQVYDLWKTQYQSQIEKKVKKIKST